MTLSGQADKNNLVYFHSVKCILAMSYVSCNFDAPNEEDMPHCSLCSASTASMSCLLACVCIVKSIRSDEFNSVGFYIS